MYRSDDPSRLHGNRPLDRAFSATMLVRDVMTCEVRTVAPDAPLQLVAQTMASLGVGSLPVCNGKSLLGMVTDRDIVVRGVAQGRPPDTPVSQCMTSEVAYAFDDEEAQAALERMQALQLRRLVVLKRDKTLAGIIAFGDIATEPDAAGCKEVGEAMAGISDPSRPRS